ncbi:MAG: DNA polymerase III subunit [Bacillota bacterium]|nr:DNA polymerase III subunit [Bacillota bacterium]
MGFEEIVGQDLAIKALRRSLLRGEIANAYLFSGAPGSGKKSITNLFAQALNCGSEDPPCRNCLVCRKTISHNHPDVYHIKPQGTSIKIGQLREVKESLYYLPEESGKKICIIHDADLLTLPASNSILQILEEPPGDLVFMLLSSRPWALLPTIISRCVHFALLPLPPEKMSFLLKSHGFPTTEDSEIVIALAGGNPGKALHMSSGSGWEKSYEEAFSLVKDIEGGPVENIFVKAEELSKRDDLRELLEILLIIYRDRLIYKMNGCLDNVLIKKFLQLNNSRKEHKSCSEGKNFNLQENTFFLEKICRNILQLEGELFNNINKRLAIEVLFLKMRGAV